MSLRSSRPRRLASLNHIEQTLVLACTAQARAKDGSLVIGVSCEEILALECKCDIEASTAYRSPAYQQYTTSCSRS